MTGGSGTSNSPCFSKGVCSSSEEPKRKPDARDCTHSSPDSMVYQLQAFFAALLGGESRIGST